MAQGKFSKPRTPQSEPEIRQSVFRNNTGVEPETEAILSEALLSETEPTPDPAMTMVFPEPPALSDTIPETFPEAYEGPVRSQTTGRLPFEPEESEEPEEDEEFTPVMGKNKKVILISICCVALVLLIGIITAICFLLRGEKDDGKILNNVMAAGINIGNMTPEEAKEALHRTTDFSFRAEDMVVELPDTTIRLAHTDTGAALDVDALVSAAYSYGRTGTQEEQDRARAESLIGNHIIALLPYLHLDQDYIRQTIEDYCAEFNSSFTPSSYELEGEMPPLTGEAFDESVPCQTLVLTVGVPGRHLDAEQLINDILDAYSLCQFRVTAQEGDPDTLPEELDLEAIHKELSLEPADAEMDMETFEVSPEQYGYTFDLSMAQKLLSKAEYGTTIPIPMKYVIPEVLAEDLEELLFRDVLGSFETRHTDDENRNTNLKLACKAINGMELDPGEEFSYNDALGKRTEAAGYRHAAAYENGETVTAIGGGICQVSSTLYNCVLLADLDVTSRTGHSFAPSYVELGMDATVSWGGPEFKFRNNTDYPIRIEAEVSGGKVRIKLLGTDEKDYYVKVTSKITDTVKPETIEEVLLESENVEGYRDGEVIQTPYTGYTVKTYKLIYSKETDTLLKEDYIGTTTYKKRDKIVAVIQPDPTEPPTEETTEATETTE